MEQDLHVFQQQIESSIQLYEKKQTELDRAIDEMRGEVNFVTEHQKVLEQLIGEQKTNLAAVIRWSTGLLPVCICIYAFVYVCFSF